MTHADESAGSARVSRSKHKVLVAYRQTSGTARTLLFHKLLNNHIDVFTLCCDINY